MRKIQQKQILETLDTIEKAQSLNLYANCQDGALALCEFIESIKGEGTQTVELLVKYCELVYKVNANEANKNILAKNLIKIRNSVNNELRPNKIEVAFFPYMASMADSLESIYLAANESLDCDAYWVPIPYYDYNPDGTLGQLQYEGDAFPDHLKAQAVDWEAYDIEVRRPDVIFAHNPYDNNNLVTCVHPNFHFGRMRNFTNMLVYVPYFVTVDDVLLSDGYCVTAGTIYADKVFVHSEKAREDYIRMFSAWAKSSGITKKNPLWPKIAAPSEKFVNLGSPKIDAVLNAMSKDFTLPVKWQQLIEKSRGKKKKVVLYNNRFTDMTAGIENQIAKVKSVLDSFKKRNDIVLWWRPHPLNMECLMSMRPQYFIEYQDIVDEYKKNGWGIYDDTPDLHRAIVYSDAYYGDHSSLVPLFRAIGKPILIQTIVQEHNVFDAKEYVRYTDFDFDEDGNAWGFELFRDGLYTLDFKNNTAILHKRSGFIPQYKGMKTLLMCRYDKIVCVNDEVFCFPKFQDSLLIYNRTKDQIKNVVLDKECLYSPSTAAFTFNNVFKYKNNIYLTSVRAKAIIIFDVKKHCIRYDKTLFMQEAFLNKYTYPLYIGNCSKDGEVTLIMKNCEHLICYNLLTQNIEYIASNVVLSQCLQADFDGKDYWLLPNKYDKLIQWNSITDKVDEYLFIEDGFSFNEKDFVFSSIIDCGKYILLLPAFGSKFLKFDKTSKKFSEYKEMPMPDENSMHFYKYANPKRVGDTVYVFALFNYTIYALNIYSEKITAHRFKVDSSKMDDELDNYRNIFTLTDNQLYEYALGDIADFFSLSINGTSNYDSSYYKKALASKEGMSGKKIFEYVRKEVL